MEKKEFMNKYSSPDASSSDVQGGKQTSSLKTTGMLVNLAQIVGAKPRYPDYLPPGYRHVPAWRAFCYNKLENINLPRPHIKMALSKH